jgi:hypothetical protein
LVQPLLPEFARDFHLSAAASLTASLATGPLAVAMAYVAQEADGGSSAPRRDSISTAARSAG